MTKILSSLLVSFLLFSFSTYAQNSIVVQSKPREYMAVRWTGDLDKDPSLQNVLNRIEKDTGEKFAASDFIQIENRDMATLHFNMWVQTAGGVLVRSGAVRTWSSLDKGETIQVEAVLAKSEAVKALKSRLASLGATAKINSKTKSKIHALVLKSIEENAKQSGNNDTQISSQKAKTYWSEKGELIQEIKVRGRRGTHTIVVSVEKLIVIESKYEEFPQSDQTNNGDEFSLYSQVYPIYEETDKGAGSGNLLNRQFTELKYLKNTVKNGNRDPFPSLRTRRYLEPLYDPVKGDTEEGRAKGYWSIPWVMREANRLIGELSDRENNFNNGVRLEGRYATINIHPAIFQKHKDIRTPLSYSTRLKFDWTTTKVGDEEVYEMLLLTGLMGRPITSPGDAYARPARRLLDHNPLEYLDDGFDELQVYYSINRLMDALHGMGFTDPELSTRPFHAFLYDPDITMRDNAYYVNDTINFTTYSPKAQNYARDNSTIWHELGHGVMDRLMGDLISLADTGGLSEGMADFVAAIVVADVTGGTPFPGSDDFRIVNKTGFHLTNESHDDGEAYGGAMKDLLDQAMVKWGRDGIHKVADLTLQSMRLTRNHPALTAENWFAHMFFADSLGQTGVREKGELTPMIVSALNGRNFGLDGSEPAKFDLLLETDKGLTPVSDANEGSRRNPVKVAIKDGQSVNKTIRISLASSKAYAFNYPVKVRVQLNGGPLQGAVRWVNEEKQPFELTLNSDQDVAVVPLGITSGCDFSNRDDGSCSDFAYVQIFDGKTTSREYPVAKKRFYVHVTPESAQK